MTTYNLLEADDDDIELYGFGEAGATNDPPVVAIVSPAVGTPVAAGDALVFDVTDPDGDALELQRVLFQLGGPSGVWEQAYADGTACAGYAVERTAITDGYRYRVTRTAGWPGGGVRLEPVFADPTGRAGIND